MKKIKNISIPAINELVKKIQDEILEGKQLNLELLEKGLVSRY